MISELVGAAWRAGLAAAALLLLAAGLTDRAGRPAAARQMLAAGGFGVSLAEFCIALDVALGLGFALLAALV